MLEDPTVVTKSTDLFCEVEVGGTLARGACAFDWYQRSQKRCNVRVVQRLDKAKVEGKLQETFLS